MAPAVAAVTRSAVNAGVLTCARRINDLSAYIARNATSGAQLFVDPVAPDQRPASVSLELSGAGQSAYASATFSPRGEGCDASYDAVVWWPESCNDVAGKYFAGLRPNGPLLEKILQLDGGASLKVFLMPAGTGCVSIKKEMVRQGP